MPNSMVKELHDLNEAAPPEETFVVLKRYVLLA
jgi:hypothetical protein